MGEALVDCLASNRYAVIVGNLGQDIVGSSRVLNETGNENEEDQGAGKLGVAANQAGLMS
jgi:hypothetical protein